MLSLVAPTNYPIKPFLKHEEDGQAALYFPEHLNARARDQPSANFDAGQLHCCRTVTFLRDTAPNEPNTDSALLPAEPRQDLRNEEDWRAADFKRKLVSG